TLGELRTAVTKIGEQISAAGAGVGSPVGALVGPGGLGVVAMFAAWSAGAVYLPINRRSTDAEVMALLAETPVDVLLGAPAELERFGPAVATAGLVAVDEGTWGGTVHRRANGTHS